MISITPRSVGGGGISGQRSQVTGISGKSPLRSRWAWGSMEVLAVGLSSVWPFETSSRKTDGEPGRAVTGGPHPPACGERGGGRASAPERWGTEACQWSRGQVVSEVAGAARMKWVCGAWPSALADYGISATTVRHRPAALPRGLRGREVCYVFAPPSSCYFRPETLLSRGSTSIRLPYTFLLFFNRYLVNTHLSLEPFRGFMHSGPRARWVLTL